MAVLREKLVVGMEVYFGRENGEKTLGKIVKLNAVKAKVETLETRGYGIGSRKGTVWSIPYSMMELPTFQKLDVKEVVKAPSELDEIRQRLAALEQSHKELLEQFRQLLSSPVVP